MIENPNFLKGLSFNFKPGPELLIGILGIVFFIIWGLSLGRTKTAISLLAIYVAFCITKIFPFFSYINLKLDPYIIEISVFLGLFVITFLVFNASFLRKRLASNEFSLFSIMLVSALQIGFLISILASFIPKDLGIKYMGQLYNFFGTQNAVFIWSVLPLPGLLVLKR